MSQDRLSVWAKGISPSPTLAVDAKAKALKAEGKDVCGFGAGEPDFDTPDFIKEACVEALRAGQTKYCPAAGLPALKQALVEKYKLDNNLEVDPAQIVVSPGGKYSCYLAILATCGPGDEVIIPAPYWVSYPEMVKLAGATPVFVGAGEEADFKITADQLREAITPKTKLVVFNSPSNPTGTIYSPKEIEALVEVCLSAGVLMMSDEIYEYLLYDDVKHLSPASLSKEAAESVITVGGFSKTFSMTGWRLGTLVAAPAIAKAVGSLQSQTSSNATTFAQYGALAAVKERELAQPAIAKMLEVFDRRRLKLLNGLNSIKGITCRRAQGAFYLFPSMSSFGLSSTDFAAKLLEEELVAVVPGVAFGADDCMRVSYATSDEVIDKGLERLARFCQQL